MAATQTAAAANRDATASEANLGAATPAGEKPAKPVSLEVRLDRNLDTAKKWRSVIRFFGNRRSLLSSTEKGAAARKALVRARHELRRTTTQVAAIRRVLHRREIRRKLRASPKHVICDVFGRRYCRQALSVAWCESRYSTTAQNGQYLGLFQMGWSERQRFGHGATARQQALAAHRYFVLSGRDWSPWGCKPSLDRRFERKVRLIRSLRVSIDVRFW
jgi:hypothetical protein